MAIESLYEHEFDPVIAVQPFMDLLKAPSAPLKILYHVKYVEKSLMLDNICYIINPIKPDTFIANNVFHGGLA